MTTPRLLNKNRVPPGGAWFYTVPETGVLIQDRMGLRNLELKIRDHYSANGLKVPDNLSELVEVFICKNVPEGFCEGDLPGVKPKRLDFFSVLGATELLFKRVISRDEKFYVPLAEASKRALICSTCPMNLLHMCTTCNGLRSTFQKLVSNRTTSYDSRIGVCAACGCGLTAKIHISKQFLPAMPESARAEVPENCWAL